jgi:hypothetical protein
VKTKLEMRSKKKRRVELAPGPSCGKTIDFDHAIRLEPADKLPFFNRGVIHAASGKTSAKPNGKGTSSEVAKIRPPSPMVVAAYHLVIPTRERSEQEESAVRREAQPLKTALSWEGHEFTRAAKTLKIRGALAPGVGFCAHKTFSASFRI